MVYDGYTGISDQALCEIISKIKHDMPESGYNMVRGILHSQGITCLYHESNNVLVQLIQLILL